MGGPGTKTRFVVVLNGGLAAAFLVAWIAMARDGSFWQADFTMFYTGWSVVLDGQGPHLYDLDVQTIYQHAIAPGRRDAGGLLPFNYPPHVALLAPVALLPLRAAFFAWAALQVVLTVVLLRQLFALLGEDRRDDRLAVAATLLGFPALFVTFQLGQLSLLAAVCLLGLALALERDRPVPAALWLVLGTLKPQLMVVPVVVLLAGRRWRVLVVAAAVFAGCAAAATLLLGPTCWADFLRLVGFSSRQVGTYGIFPERMYNLKAPLLALFGVDRFAAVHVVSLTAFAGGLLLAAALWRGRWPGGVEFRLRLAVCLQVGLLTNLHFNPADALVFVVPAALFWTALPRGSAVAAVLVGCPLLFLVDCFGRAAWPGGVRPFFVVMAALAVAMAWALRRAPAAWSALETGEGQGTIPSFLPFARGCPADEHPFA